jgi:ATP phosphoribosyltransferase
MEPSVNEFCIAIPKKGRLTRAFSEVLEMADLSYIPAGERRDCGVLNDRTGEFSPLKTRCMAQTDSLRRLRDGVVDLAIVGYDTLNEFNCAAKDVRFKATPLNISSCAMWIAAPKASPVTQWSDLSGKRIATSYPATLQNQLERNNVTDYEIVEFDGGVEESIDMGIADAICDLVDTGSTLKANNLVPCIRLYNSSAMMVRRADDQDKPQAEAIRRRLALAADRVANLQNPSFHMVA